MILVSCTPGDKYLYLGYCNSYILSFSEFYQGKLLTSIAAPCDSHSMITQDKKIYIIGDIDHEAFLKFTRRLSRIESNHPDGDRVHIVLSSNGGEGMVGLAFYDRIRLSPMNITITAVGLVASAAIIVLAAGSKRYMAKSAWCMVHDDKLVSEEVKNRRLAQVEGTIAHARRVEDQWNQLLEERTGTSAYRWDALHRNETYLSAKECLDLNLIQEII